MFTQGRELQVPKRLCSAHSSSQLLPPLAPSPVCLISPTHIHTQPADTSHTDAPCPNTSIRNKRTRGHRQQEVDPFEQCWREGMDHVTLGVGCAFFGIMIGHFQVWLARHVIPPFPRPNTDVPPSPHAKLHKEDNICELMRARTPGCVVLETEWMDATSLIEAPPQHPNTIILD